MTTPPELLETFTVETGAARIVFDVLRRESGEIVCRMGRGNGTGVALSTMQVANLRLVLSRVLGVMAQNEGRTAA